MSEYKFENVRTITKERDITSKKLLGSSYRDFIEWENNDRKEFLNNPRDVAHDVFNFMGKFVSAKRLTAEGFPLYAKLGRCEWGILLQSEFLRLFSIELGVYDPQLSPEKQMKAIYNRSMEKYYPTFGEVLYRAWSYYRIPYKDIEPIIDNEEHDLSFY